MKGVLFDENLPARLAFEPRLPVQSVRSLGRSVTDSQVWDYARRKKLVIVSKDADFSARMMLAAPPPWVVHLRFGNMRRRDFHALLARVWPQIDTLLKKHKLVTVYADHVEGVR
jgi:predicted nuclease of predicted toxin-antitoxin system